jgi:ubiquinone/menaquinone biosynthesis C-methylase UbiE
VVGLDSDPAIIDRARRLAAERGVDNAQFEVGDIRSIGHADGSFDAAFAHLSLFHVASPLIALREMRRLLRPGGVVGIFDGLPTAQLIVPMTPLARERLDLEHRAQQHCGGSPDYAVNQRALLLEAGFRRAEQTAFGRAAGSAELTRAAAAFYEQRFRGYARTALEQGWIDQARVDEIIEDLRQWSVRPDAFALSFLCAAVAFVDL